MKKTFLAVSLCAVMLSAGTAMAADALLEAASELAFDAESKIEEMADEAEVIVEEAAEAAETVIEEAAGEVEEVVDAAADAAAAASSEAAELMEAVPEGAQVDVAASASVVDFYGDFGISGDELMNAVNSYTGSYIVATVNEDGTPQVGFYVYSMVKDEETGIYYALLGLAANQTRVNLERTKEAMAVYAANPEADAQEQYAKVGARMQLKLVEDEELAAKLNTTGYDTAMVCEVVSVRSLG